MNTLMTSCQQPDILQLAMQRSLGHGLNRCDHVDANYLRPGQLSSRQQEYANLLQHLSNYGELFERLQGGKSSRLLVADRDGAILYSSGCNEFGDKASRLMLEPGAQWGEATMGTNAIGTALFEQSDVQVLGHQHFMLANQSISCSASPIFDPNGQLLAVLDISSENAQHGGDMLFTARLLALCIENAMLSQQQDTCWLLSLAKDSLHMQQPWSGLLALNEAGEVIGANRVARNWLKQFQPEQLLNKLQPGQITEWAGGSALLARKLDTEVSVVVPKKIERSNVDDVAQRQALRLLDAGIALLIQGETGVGKDYFVRQLHSNSLRANAPLIAVNCGALPAELIEAELFGYVSGAFTGSDKNGRLGYVRAAHGGVLFLDEIGELPLGAQTKLLRVLQEKRVTPVGSHHDETVDFHVIAATNKNLQELVQKGLFREDLFFRLNGYQVDLPPLREYERDEFVQLVRRLLAGKQSISEQLMESLLVYNWPGNIRQLQQQLEVALVLADGGGLTVEHFPVLHQCTASQPEVRLQANSIQHALSVLKNCGGNVSAAARELGISRTTLYSYMKQESIK